jgi:Pyridoxamine 5'-phosphate oxidase
MTKELIHRFMDSQQLAVFSSICSTAQRPQSALVGIAVTSDLEVVFDTVRSSRKYQNLIQNPASSLVIGCAGAVTVQYEGDARELSGSELATLQAIYFAKWPDGPTRLSWPGITYIAVKPRWIRYSDFSSPPPVIEELMFAQK